MLSGEITTKIKVKIEVPSCKYCFHRYGNTCNLFGQELTSYGNVGDDDDDDDWVYIRCDECKQAEVEDEY